MKKIILSIFAALSCSMAINAQTKVQLWPDGAPGAKVSEDYKEIIEYWKNDPEHPVALKVTDPTLEIFRPDGEVRNKTAIVICPGGAYMIEALSLEGYSVAKALAAKGYVTAVLKYRLPHTASMEDKAYGPLADAQRAIRTIRSMASELGVEKVGIMGFSAGGHLAATVSTLFDKKVYSKGDDNISARPDFSVLGYPVISLQKEITHAQTRENLIGGYANEDELEKALSAQNNVTANTPPAFIFVASEDDTVPVANSLLYAQAMAKAGQKFELHVFHNGPHGFGLGNEFRAGEWQQLLDEWLVENVK